MTMKHTTRDTTGRYSNSPACDCCNKPVGTDYQTDAEVCGNGDGPGFYLCNRKRCEAKRAVMTAAERSATYTAQRASR